MAVKGSAPGETSIYFAGSTLMSLNKNKAGEKFDIRPMAVGEIYQRVAANCLCMELQMMFSDFLEPQQLGMACSGGVKRIVHQMHSTVETSQIEILYYSRLT